MKFGSIRRALVRWLDPGATTLPPKIDRFADAVKRIAEGLGGPGAVAIPLGNGAFRIEQQQGIKPPDDPDTNGWTWESWSKQLQAYQHPGWSFCRFGNRMGPNSVGFVFGIVRGAFGVWERNFDVSTTSKEGEHERKPERLVSITHLRSGMGVGIFQNRELAMEAADLAERVCAEWSGLDITQAMIMRTNEAWQGIGIGPCRNAHAHDPTSPDLTYWIQGRSDESVAVGKPERLS